VSLANLGLAHLDLGDPALAEESWKRRLRLARELKNRSSEALALVDLGHLSLRRGDLDLVHRRGSAARELAREAQDPEGELFAMGLLLQEALAREDVAETDALLREATGRLESLPAGRFEPTDGMGLRERLAGWAELAEDAAMLLEERLSGERVRIVSEAFRRAGLWKGAMLLELLQARTGRDRRDGLVFPGGVDPDVVRDRVLDRDSVLVEFASGARTLRARVLTTTSLDTVELGPKEEIAAELRALIGGLSDVRTLPSAASLARRAHALHQRLLAPCLERAGGRRRLVVIPDATVAGLPFEALVTRCRPQDNDVAFRELEYVLDRFLVTYSPSAPVLVALAGLRRDGLPRPALVVADPGSGELLPGARREALEIARRLGPGQTRLYLGEEAHEGRLRTGVGGFRLVHVAAHAEEDPQGAVCLRLAPGGGEDGSVTAPEIAALELAADLVVLSACRSNRGVVRQAEGVRSLAWAFLAAGARGVVATAWPVEDAAGGALIGEFYRLLGNEGLPAALALHQARLSMRQRRPDRGDPLAPEPAHPFFWAPFVAVGPL